MSTEEQVPANTRAAGELRDTGPEPELAAIFGAFVQSQNMKNMPGILNCLHEESPALNSMHKSLETLLDCYTLQVGIQDQSYAGVDDCYAYYRFTQKIEKSVGRHSRICRWKI